MSLREAMTEYRNADFPLDEERFLSAIIVLQEYCKAHEYLPEYTSDIENFLKKFEITPPNLLVGAVEYQKETILENSKAMFSNLALNRISVRDYSPTEVDDTLIFDSIRIAMKSPSVCNRQSWRVHLIKDRDLLERTLTLQGGFDGNGTNLNKLLLVTVDLRYFSNFYERNQGYIDGGIFLMSLVYALTYNEVATCILNAMFNRKRDQEIRDLIGLEESEVMIGFIALGHYPDVFKAPASLRDSVDKCLKIH
jgi:nitroreductase